MHEKWKTFEQRVVQAFNLMMNEDLVSAVSVEWNKKVQGTHTTHQSDGHVEYVVAGTTRRIFIECKDHARPVEQGEVLKLAARISDLPGYTGIMVSRNGFQKGAKNAANSGISLFTFREQADVDWRNYIREIHLSLVVITPGTEVFVALDGQWMLDQGHEVTKETRVEPVKSEINNIRFFSEDGSPLKSVGEMIDEHVKTNSPSHGDTLSFPVEDIYIKTTTKEWPHIKVAKIGYKYTESKTTIPMRFDVGMWIQFILKNVIEGTDFALDEGLTSITKIG